MTGVQTCALPICCLVAVGELAEYIAQGARDFGVPQVYYCADKAKAKEILPSLVRSNSTFLLKASRGMKLEELTACLVEQTKEA